MKPLAVLAFILALVSAGASFYALERQIPASVAVEKETAFARVLRTHTLRCAYIVYPPETIKDPNTGKLSGTIVDTTEEIGRQLGWKIEWVGEVGFADMFDGFKSGKYDALCAGLYENPARAEAALFSVPFNYGATYAFARANDTRFDTSLEAIDDPNVKIALIDGEIAQFIANENFPKAAQYTLPPSSDLAQILESVAAGKADIGFLQITPSKIFMEHNPGQLKVLSQRPVRAFPAPLLALPHGEFDLKFVIDATLRSLQENGFVEQVLRKYDPNLDSYLLVAKPYQPK